MTTPHHPIDPSQLLPADLQKITDYIAILISIDQKNKRKAKGSNSHEK